MITHKNMDRNYRLLYRTALRFVTNHDPYRVYYDKGEEARQTDLLERIFASRSSRNDWVVGDARYVATWPDFIPNSTLIKVFDFGKEDLFVLDFEGDYVAFLGTRIKTSYDFKHVSTYWKTDIRAVVEYRLSDESEFLLELSA